MATGGIERLALVGDGSFLTTKCADGRVGATSGGDGDGAGMVSGLSKPLTGEGDRAGEVGSDKGEMGDCFPADGLSASTGMGRTGHPSFRRLG